MLSSRSQPSTSNMNFKTPARSIKRGKTVHNENSIHGHPKTVGFTGRNKNNVLFSTPAVNAPLQSRLKTDKAPRLASKSTALAEITNQTPFKAFAPVTPAASLNLPKSFTIFKDDSVVPSTHRISSSRKKLRLPRSANRNFVTPETKGNYWDVSDVSIEGSMIEETSISGEDYDDVEYAPPTAIDPKYDPGFDMPDYKIVGATLMSLFKQTTLSDDHDPLPEFDGVDLLEDIGPIVWEKIELPEILPKDIFPFVTQSEKRPHVPKVETSTHSRPTGARSALPSKYVPLRKSGDTPLSTGKVTHTRIPSLSKPRVTQAGTQSTRPMLNSRATGSSHTRTTSAPLRTAKVTHQRTGSMPSRNMAAKDSKPTNMSRAIVLSKPVTRFVSSNERTPGMKQTDVPDFGNELLGGEFLFTI